MSAVELKFIIDMTWGCLILPSLSKKRPKNTFQTQVVPTIGGFACAPWLQQHSISAFLGHLVCLHVLVS